MMGPRIMVRGIYATCAVVFVAGLVCIFGGIAQRVAIGLVAVSVLASMGHDLFCRYVLDRHVVYRLVNDGGRTLYVGSTDDVVRRLNEHTDGNGEPWRRDIHAMRIHRSVASEAQARRIERRLIRCMTYAVGREWCRPLRNEVWAQPPANPLAKLVTWAWMWLYVAQSFVFADCGWAGEPHTFGTWILAEHRPGADAEDWPDATEAHHSTTHGDDPLTATYERDASTPGRHAFTPIALPPVRDVTRDENPLRSRGSHQRDNDAGRHASRDQPDATDERHVDGGGGAATMVDEEGYRYEPATPDETPEERRKRLGRNRAARYRQAKKSAGR
jgi:predicted GIY-YIG superfamily endonuclease